MSKLKQRIAGLQELKYSMKQTQKKCIVQGVFNSVLCYCLPLFGGMTKEEISSLQVQQNRAAGIALGLPLRFNREYMYTKLNWMTVNQLIAYHTLLSVHRIQKTREPAYLANILGKTNRRGHIIVGNCRLELARKSFTFRGLILFSEPNFVEIVC